jgi:hypothetical protein
MIFKNSICNIVFPKIDNMRRKAFEIEDHLQDYFNAVNTIPVPDNAPAEIPRISTTTHHGHSTLNISLNNAQLITSFDGDFNNDAKKALLYMEERVYKIANILGAYTNNVFLFSGLTTEIIVESADPVQQIIGTLFKTIPKNKFHEINVKTTQIIRDKYYANIAISNERSYEGFIPPGMDQIIKLANMELKNHSLKYTIDVNDRHGFNTEIDYVSTIENIKEVFEIKRMILEQKLDQLLSEGVMDL